MSAPDSFTVRLERVFHGPMDLLLHLVREQEVEIAEVEINRVLQGYLGYVQAMRDLDIEIAGDFLVMAATLMAIKSRSLLPRESVDLDDELDPRDELIQRLVEYRRFREASEALAQRYEIRTRMHERGNLANDEPVPDGGLELGEITTWDLLAAFSRLARETLANRPHKVRADGRPLRFYVQSMARAVRDHDRLALRDLVLSIDDEPTRETLIGSFCALLELVKLGIVRVHQGESGGEIEVARTVEGEADLDEVLSKTVFDDERPRDEQDVLEESEEASASGPAAG